MIRQTLEEIELEVGRQKRLKAEGKFSHTAEDFMVEGDAGKMLAVLTEEIGEVARAINDNEPCVKLREELVQVAAVAVSAIAGLDYAMVAKASAI